MSIFSNVYSYPLQEGCFFSTFNDSLFALNQSDKMINSAFIIFTDVSSVGEDE